MTMIGGKQTNGKASSPLQVPPDRKYPVRILLGEDIEINQKLTSKILEKKGCQVSVASNGLEVLRCLENEHYDMVFMDIQMPQLDGFETTKIIREKEKKEGTHIPIIAMAAYTSEEDRGRCIQAGMDACISKPVHLQEIFAVIDKMLPLVKNQIPSCTSSFDHQSFMELCYHDTILAKEILETFLEQSPGYMSSIRQAISSADFPALEKNAHSLKGVVGNFMAEEIVDAAKRLELMARNQEISQAEVVWHWLTLGMERLTASMRLFLKELDS